jgi:hypothetical protein
MSNNKQSSVEWLVEQIQNNIHHTIRIPSDIIEQSKAMHNEEKLTNYSDGYLEGFNRALDLVELTVEEYKHDIFYDKGLVKIHSRIKELRG